MHRDFATAPRDGRIFMALSGCTDNGQMFRFMDGEFWQFVPFKDTEIKLKHGEGTWHRPFFTPIKWRFCQ